MSGELIHDKYLVHTLFLGCKVANFVTFVLGSCNIYYIYIIIIGSSLEIITITITITITTDWMTVVEEHYGTMGKNIFNSLKYM